MIALQTLLPGLLLCVRSKILSTWLYVTGSICLSPLWHC